MIGQVAGSQETLTVRILKIGMATENKCGIQLIGGRSAPYRDRYRGSQKVITYCNATSITYRLNA